MKYKNIDNALKKSYSGSISLNAIISGQFYHFKKGWSHFSCDDIHIIDLIDILGGRKRLQLIRGLEYCISHKINFYLFDRIIYNKYGWSYIAGQDYVSELNEIRKFLYKY